MAREALRLKFDVFIRAKTYSTRLSLWHTCTISNSVALVKPDSAYSGEVPASTPWPTIAQASCASSRSSPSPNTPLTPPLTGVGDTSRMSLPPLDEGNTKDGRSLAVIGTSNTSCEGCQTFLVDLVRCVVFIPISISTSSMPSWPPSQIRTRLWIKLLK